MARSDDHAAQPAGWARRNLILRIQSSLAWKFAASLSVLVVIVLGLHAWWNNPRAALHEQKRIEARRLGDIVSAIVVKEMLAGEPWRVQEHLDFIEAHEGVQRIRVFDPDSILRYASDPSKIEEPFDRMQDDDCRQCHATASVVPPTIERHTATGEHVFSYSFTLENETNCRECHAEAGSHLGKVVLDISFSDADQLLLAGNRRLAMSAIFLILLITAGVWIVTHVLVQRPAQALARASRRIEEGDFAASFPEPGSDELGVATRAVARMSKRLASLVEHQEAEIIRRTRELQRSQEKLAREEKLAALGRMIAGVAHEIGNPTSAISAVAQVVQRRADDAFIRDQAEEILAQVDRIDHLVRDLTHSYRSGSVHGEAVDLRPLIEDAIRAAAYDRRWDDSVATRVSIEEGCPPVWIAREHLLQVLLNLLFNAADAIEGEGSIEVRAWRGAGGVSIEVEDDGSGIDRKDLDSVFEPFFTRKSRGRGTGLGLWVCYTLVDRWGGNIGVESEVGRGTRVALWLPSHRSSLADDHARIAQA